MATFAARVNCSSPDCERSCPAWAEPVYGLRAEQLRMQHATDEDVERETKALIA